MQLREENTDLSMHFDEYHLWTSMLSTDGHG